ncbi:LamG-like jellyroll fold domain-containing protein [Flavobacterium sp. 7A]|uniref:LamG-like jellyroll fold domain-containing protein n=1 Tax=Flavobacterium sp. 7A TaxID=2940571 RepID=UPI0022265E98|nr:LamG-like jellyroll fold domain-containing protein [Flavobacterium sp. 7A]MCW2119530.1 hypothetical protein [Flavobacterium sp. 7A]
MHKTTLSTYTSFSISKYIQIIVLNIFIYFISTSSVFALDVTSYSFTDRKEGGAAVSNPEINILGNTNSIVDGDSTPSIVDWTIFGSMEVSTGAIVKKYTIQNTGAGTLIIGTITISGRNASDFTVIKNPSTLIPARGSSTFSVRFDPTTIGLKRAEISIINNDLNENPYNFDIQGTGIQSFFDSDGDGVYDNFDIDDDNDGILDITEENNCNSVNGPKVDYKFLNETFGTGGRTSNFTTAYNATTSYCYEDGIAGPNTTECPYQSSKILDDGEYTVVSKIAGTTSSDPDNIHGDLAWYNGLDHTPGDTDGRMAVFNASFTPGTFYETTITGVLSNLPITYSFWVLNIMAQSTFPRSILPNVTVEFYDLSDNLISSFNTGDIGRCPGSKTDNSCSLGVWQQFTTNVNLGNVNAFTIRFKNNAPGGGGNDLALDDILISQTLCDLDNDGVADLFDLDADNDGIEDIIEVGLGHLSNSKGKIDVVWLDTNGNGLHDSAETIAGQPALDSDGDGIPNYMDLDSDNDSLFDVDESGAGNSNAVLGYINGDGDINGDGVGDGIESETFRLKDTNGDGTTEGFGDGILDIYDYGSGINGYGNLGQGIANINPATTFLKDTDGDGIPDYLDVKSNGITFDIANNKVLYPTKILDANNDGILDGTTDLDKDGILDIFDTNNAQFGSPRDIDTKLYLNFDGRNDYAEGKQLLSNLAKSSLMGWVKLNSPYNKNGVIMGQDNFNISINDSNKLVLTAAGQTITSTTTLDENRWYHISAVFNGTAATKLSLYLNGNEVITTDSGTSTLASSTAKFTIAKKATAFSDYFNGFIDEVRVFNTALSQSQIQKMMCQEIDANGSFIRGVVIPKDIELSVWATLIAYYRMDVYKNDVIDDYKIPGFDDSATNTNFTRIYNVKNINSQSAPMPYITKIDGTIDSAVDDLTNNFIKGTDVYTSPGSIVKIVHNVTTESNMTNIGMFVNSSSSVTTSNDTKIGNTWYLKLDGKIDLVGKSQLIQTTESDLDFTSSGFIERDQLGQGNKYNYNYWASPVSCINSTQNNTDHCAQDVMRDGTTTIPQNINWIDGYDGNTSTPISIARYWLYKFDNYSNAYANWVQINETGKVRAGQGFTMKGNNGINTTQNYTFVGKPNSGTISTNSVGADQLLLTGNPYPSSLDAFAFINDNLTSFDGNIYFWEHYTNNNTHILRDYQGGYAVLNLIGGIPASSAMVSGGISGLGVSSKGKPNQFIPVGQAFFVFGKSGGGGPIIYKNSQRAFHKENELDKSNMMFRVSTSSKTKSTFDNSNDPIIDNYNYKKVRLGYTSAVNFHRQVLLGFMNDKATSLLDDGYDAYLFDDFPNDMTFFNNDTKLVIQGEGYFDKNTSMPLAVTADQTGKVVFTIDSFENFESDEKFYIHDKENNTYNNITNNPYEIIIDPGEYLNRFALTFNNINQEQTLSVTDSKTENELILVSYVHNSTILNIQNNTTKSIVKNVHLYDVGGKLVSNWNTRKLFQATIQLSLNKLSTGVYIVALETNTGKISKQIIVP